MNRTLSTVTLSAPIGARLFLRLLNNIRHGHLELITPCDTRMVFGDAHAASGATLKLHDWRACQRILRAGDIGFAEAYAAGWVSTPDLSALLRLALRNEASLNQLVFGGALARCWYRLRHWLRPNTRKGSMRNIHAHYDIGNNFYQLWLDPSWTYSSALFDGDYQLTLQDAQRRKYQRIIDTLQLRPGQRVLEIGCGWGGFAEQAAQQGIHVHGVTISPSQLEVAQRRVQVLGLNERVQLELCDYRDLRGEYDAVVSIEMFEAVGEQYWPQYFRTVAAAAEARCTGAGTVDHHRRTAFCALPQQHRFHTAVHFPRRNAAQRRTFRTPGGPQRPAPSRTPRLRPRLRRNVAPLGRSLPPAPSADRGPGLRRTLHADLAYVLRLLRSCL